MNIYSVKFYFITTGINEEKLEGEEKVFVIAKDITDVFAENYSELKTHGTVRGKPVDIE